MIVWKRILCRVIAQLEIILILSLPFTIFIGRYWTMTICFLRIIIFGKIDFT